MIELLTSEQFEKERLNKLTSVAPDDKLRLMAHARESAMPLTIRFDDTEVAHILDSARRGRRCTLCADSLWILLVTMAADLELARKLAPSEKPCTYDRAYPTEKGNTDVRLYQSDSPTV